MTFFRSILLATVLIFGHSLAQAQQAAPAPAAPSVAPLTESHVAVAREVVIGSGLARTFQGMVPQIADQIRGSYTRTRPEIVKDMEESLKAMIEDLSKQTEQITVSAARLYANRLTEAELKDIAAFFKSGAGQKYVNFQAQILNDLFTEMQVFSQTLGNVMVDRLREDLRKKGHTI